jgi:hypothetical protein
MRMTLKAFDGFIGCFHPLEAARRPDQALECSTISLDDIIEIFRCPVLDVMRQVTFSLQAPDWLLIVFRAWRRKR